MEVFGDVSKVLLYLGFLAFLVSTITEVLKKWTWFEEKTHTAIVVIAISIILCPVSLLGMASYYGIVIEWYMVFASFIAAFIVALISMDGWERVNELANKLIKK